MSTNRFFASLCAAVLCAGFAGCGGGGGNDSADVPSMDVIRVNQNASCVNNFLHPGAVVTVQCVACVEPSEPGLANDGNFASFAPISFGFGMVQNTGWLRVDAAPGISFPPGSEVGAFIGVPAGVAQSISFRYTTYIGDEMADTGVNGMETNGIGGGGVHRVRFSPTQAYDALQIDVIVSNGTQTSVENPNGDPVDFEYYEFCAN